MPSQSTGSPGTRGCCKGEPDRRVDPGALRALDRPRAGTPDIAAAALPATRELPRGGARCDHRDHHGLTRRRRTDCGASSGPGRTRSASRSSPSWGRKRAATVHGREIRPGLPAPRTGPSARSNCSRPFRSHGPASAPARVCGWLFIRPLQRRPAPLVRHGHVRQRGPSPPGLPTSVDGDRSGKGTAASDPPPPDRGPGSAAGLEPEAGDPGGGPLALRRTRRARPAHVPRDPAG